MADEAFDTRELGQALEGAVAPTAAPPSTSTPQRPLTILDIPNDVLVSILSTFHGILGQTWLRRTIPLVHPRWAELYRSKDASPLREALMVDFEKEVERAKEAGQGGGESPPLVHASKVISWAERHAGSVKKLFICGIEDGATKDFSFEEMGRLVTATGPSLTDLCFDFSLYLHSQVRGELRRARGGRYLLPDLGPFWKAMRDSVAPAGRLRMLGITSAGFSEPDLEPLGQLAGSLEKLVLWAPDVESPLYPRPGDPGIPPDGIGLPRFPELLCDLTELQLLYLFHHQKIEAIPAKISSLKKLEELNLTGCGISSLPKELGELSGLESLRLTRNPLGRHTPGGEAFPAALRRMKSLRQLFLNSCGLRAVPAFVGKLESLVILDLTDNRGLGDAPEHSAFPAALGRSESLGNLNLTRCGLRAVPVFVSELESLMALILAGNKKLGDAPQDEAFPAELKKMEYLQYLGLDDCGLRSVPTFVSELPNFGILSLSLNEKLGAEPEHSAFPAALGGMKFLRELHLSRCGLRAVPSFVFELESLDTLELSHNDGLKIDAPLDFLIERCPRLREVRLHKKRDGVPWSPEALVHLDAFKAKLRAKNPGAKVSYESGSEIEDEFESESEGEGEDEDESDEGE